MDVKKLARLALLLALALALSYAERLLPLQLLVPLPGVKLGLANVITLFLLYAMDAPSAAAVLLPRCLLGALFGGGVTGLAYSLTGGVFALFAMVLAKKSGFFSLFGVSVLGAAAHACGQIAAAAGLLGSVYIISYLPLLLGVAAPCGLFTAALTAGVLRAAARAELN